MKALELVAEVDAHRRLHLDLPKAALPGPVRVLVLLSEADEASTSPADGADADAAWARGIAHE